MNHNKSYTAVGKIVIVLVLLSLPVNCKPFTGIDIPVDEKTGRIEKGLFPVNGFPPWKRVSIYERMRHYKVPGVSIAVIDDFKLEWAKGYGVMTAEGKIPITTNTLFQAVGVGSTVSRFLALNFVDRGIIDLNEDVNHKPVSWKIPENEFTAKNKVTYIVLRQLLEDVAKKPFHEIAREIILEPLGMKNSTFEQPLPKEYRHMAATGHVKDGQPGPVKKKWHTFPETAARGLWTTPTDLARLAVELMKTCNGQSQKIISQDLVYRLVNPRRSFYRFNGSAAGFDCFLAFNYKTGQGVVLMINSNYAYTLRKEILHSVFSQNRWRWGHFTMAKTIFTGMLLVIAIGIMALIIILGGMLFFLGKRKKI